MRQFRTELQRECKNLLTVIPEVLSHPACDMGSLSVFWHSLCPGTQSCSASTGELTTPGTSAGSHGFLGSREKGKALTFLTLTRPQGTAFPGRFATDAFSELLFSRQTVLSGFPGCSHAGFLVGKCHPVAKCETLTAPACTLLPGKVSQLKHLQQGQFPLPMVLQMQFCITRDSCVFLIFWAPWEIH